MSQCCDSHLTGYDEEELLHHWMDQHDALILPLSDREGAPTFRFRIPSDGEGPSPWMRLLCWRGHTFVLSLLRHPTGLTVAWLSYLGRDLPAVAFHLALQAEPGVLYALHSDSIAPWSREDYGLSAAAHVLAPIRQLGPEAVQLDGRLSVHAAEEDGPGDL